MSDENNFVVDHWFDMIAKEFDVGPVEFYYNLYSSGHLQFFCIEQTGIFAYMIHDMCGKKVLSELVMYIKPCYRGNLKLVKKYILRAESIAKESACSEIMIGGNIGYKDALFLTLLKRWGYADHTVSKRI